MMRKNFKVEYGEPNPAYKAYAHAVLDLTYCRIDEHDDPHLQRKRKEAGLKLAELLNGDWRSTKVTHYCRLGCCKTNQAARAVHR